MADMRDDELELFFEAGRAAAPMPSQDLLARVLAEAEAEQALAQPADARPAQPAAEKRGLWAGLVATIGGWPAVAGLATATVAGVWIGYAQPDGVAALASGVWPSQVGYDLVDMVPSYDGLFVDG